MAIVSADTLRELMLHMEWADACVWRAMLAHPIALQDARLRDLLLHLHHVQQAFLAVWKEQPLDPSVMAAAAADVTVVPPLVRAYYHDLHATVASFDDAALRRPVVMPWVGEFEQHTGRRFETPTLAETMLQIASHSTYHRGQVNARLREVGGEPPLVDYIAWIWFGRPAPEWAPAASQSARAAAT